MPMLRDGVGGAVIGNRFYLASGMIQSAGGLVMQDPRLKVTTSSVDILELPGAKSGREERDQGVGPTRAEALHPLRHQEPGRAKDAREVLARAVTLMRVLPESDTHSWKWWWYTHWIKGYPAFMWEESQKHKTDVIASLPPSVQSLAKATWDGCQAHPYNPDNPEQYQQWYIWPGIA